MRRGEIWWARLPTPSGSEPGYERPVLIVQDDAFTKSAIQTVIGIAITSNTKLADAPGNVALTRKQSGLSKPSVANVSQIVTINKDFLTRKVSAVPAQQLKNVEYGLRLVLGL